MPQMFPTSVVMLYSFIAIGYMLVMMILYWVLALNPSPSLQGGKSNEIFSKKHLLKW